MKIGRDNHVRNILVAGFFMALGALLFKYLPMKIWGDDILFDASMHIISTSFILYILWFFIDQNKDWHTPYFIFGALILFVISSQRLLIDAHSDVGLGIGILISVISIGIAEWGSIKNKIQF